MKGFWAKLLKLRLRFLILFGVMGPGLITAFADNDAGGVATYSVAASKYGYAMLTTLLPITLVLMISQEIGARIAIVSGKGLGDLIRERFGIKTSLVMFFLLFTVNFAVILQNLGGLKEALRQFNLNYFIFLPLLILFLFIFIAKASYSNIEKFFMVLILFYLAYFFSAILAKPDPGLIIKSLVYPTGKISFDYLFTAIAVLGTTVTAWGQFFINSYVKDKKISIDHLKYEQAEIYAGAFLTDLFSLFMMVAVAATLFQNKIVIHSAADAAVAIKPLAGSLAGSLFALGLLIAGFLGCAIVPLSTAYAFSEFFGLEGSLDVPFHKSRFFYIFFFVQIFLGMLVILLPGINLFNIALYASFFNGIILPVIFYFLYKFANNQEIMGKHKNNGWQNFLLISSAVVIIIASLIGGLGTFFSL